MCTSSRVISVSDQISFPVWKGMSLSTYPMHDAKSQGYVGYVGYVGYAGYAGYEGYVALATTFIGFQISVHGTFLFIVVQTSLFANEL